MTIPLDWDPTPLKTKRLPPLQVPAPHGVLAFDGARNPLTRSNSAHRVSFAMATPATAGVPQIYHFESEAEFAVALEASLDPDIFRIEVQLPPLRYQWKFNKNGYRDHYFDLRLTFTDNYRRAIYVKNGKGLSSERTQAEIAAIFAAITPDFADEAFVVNADSLSQQYRDNLRRFWYLCQVNQPDDDAIVHTAACSGHYWILDDLIKLCPISPERAYQSALRLIARRILCANLHAVVTVHSRVWLAA